MFNILSEVSTLKGTIVKKSLEHIFDGIKSISHENLVLDQNIIDIIKESIGLPVNNDKEKYCEEEMLENEKIIFHKLFFTLRDAPANIKHGVFVLLELSSMFILFGHIFLKCYPK